MYIKFLDNISSFLVFSNNLLLLKAMKKTGLVLILLTVATLVAVINYSRNHNRRERQVITEQSLNRDSLEKPDSIYLQNSSAVLQKPDKNTSVRNVIIGTVIVLIMFIVFYVLIHKFKSKYWPEVLLFKTPSKVGNQGSAGNCKLCGIPVFGEETVVEMQKSALYMERSAVKAIRIESQSGYACAVCSRIYCKDCLEKKAPPHIEGGKACPVCKGRFVILHG
jgi:hypothetical protein